MNDVGIYNLKQIEINYRERLEKAKIYNDLIDDRVAFKMECFKNENALLEYTIILKNVSNKIAHSKLMERGYDIRHTWYINNTKEKNNLDPTNFKDTYFIEEYILCLPVHKNISCEDIKKISAIINTFI